MSTLIIICAVWLVITILCGKIESLKEDLKEAQKEAHFQEQQADTMEFYKNMHRKRADYQEKVIRQLQSRKAKLP